MPPDWAGLPRSRKRSSGWSVAARPTALILDCRRPKAARRGFAKRLWADRDAVRAAVTLDRSSGQKDGPTG